MVIFQLFIVLLIALLDFGPLGAQATTGLNLGLGVVSCWAFTWFGEQKSALRFALLLGLCFDLVSFMGFGVWLAIFSGTYFITDLLKTRFFEVSSIALALITLAVVSVWSALVLGVVARSLDPLMAGIGVLTNVVAGLILYYFLAIRFKFFARWRGRRL